MNDQRWILYLRTVFVVSLFLLLLSALAYPAEVPYISFSSNQDGNWDIYTIDINGENLHNLTSRRRTSDIIATWSPNGYSFAYSSDPNGHSDIYVMNVETKKNHRLTKDPGSDVMAAWSPDGQWIAFCSDRSGAFEIYKMDVHGKNLQRLTRLPGKNTSPAWSPDSQSIVFNSFWRNKDGIREQFLYVMDADGQMLSMS